MNEADNRNRNSLPVVRIERRGDDPLTGTVLYVNGQEIPNLFNVEFKHQAGTVALVTAEMNLITGISFEAPASVLVQIVALPGYEIVSSPLKPGGQSYKVVPEQKEENKRAGRE